MTENQPPASDDGAWVLPNDSADAPQPTPGPPATPAAPPAWPAPDAFGPGAFSAPPGASWASQQPPSPPYPQQPNQGQPYAQQSYPQQAYAQQPYASQPHPGQQYPGQQYPGQPFYPPQGPAQYQTPYAAPVAQKPKRTGLVILLSMLGVCLVLVAVGLLTAPRTNTTGSPVQVPVPGGGTTTVVTTGTASDALTGYLQALSTGNADAALAYLASPPSDTTLLTNEVLAAGNALAPISDIQVEPSSSSYTAAVTARYRIGDQEVEATYQLVDSGSGWKLVLATALVDASQLGDLSASLNGVAINAGSGLTLFPGSYRLTTADDRYQVTGGDFVVESPDATPELGLSVGLSDAGRAAIRSAAQKRLTACIKENKMTPSDGCGLSIRSVDENGKKFTAKKVRWRITGGANAMKSLKLTLGSDPTIARASTKVKLYMRVDATNGRWYYANVSITSVRASLEDDRVDVRFNE